MQFPYHHVPKLRGDFTTFHHVFFPRPEVKAAIQLRFRRSLSTRRGDVERCHQRNGEGCRVAARHGAVERFRGGVGMLGCWIYPLVMSK